MNYKDCKKIEMDGLIGAEDMVRVVDDLFITGTDNRFELWEISRPSLVSDGGLYAINPSRMIVKKLPLHHFPERVSFHPHGLFLFVHDHRKYLYVINHAYAKGGERIDIFEVKGTTYDDLTVEYFQSLTPEVFSQLAGTLNDLVVIEPGKLFVTQYRPFGDMMDGRDFHSNMTMGKVHGVFNLVSTLYKLNLCPTWVCTFDHKHPGDTDASCSKASDGISMSNGIAIGPDGKILVANPLENLIVVYTYDSQKNRLIEEETIDTIRAVDNLVVDSTTGNIYGGTLLAGEILSVTQVASTTHKKPTDAFVSGGSVEITKLSKNNWKAVEIVFVPGKIFSGISVSARSGDMLLFGSWYDDGVLVCPYP